MSCMWVDFEEDCDQQEGFNVRSNDADTRRGRIIMASHQKGGPTVFSLGVRMMHCS